VFGDDAADILARLVAKSLVNVGERAHGSVRYTMLESIAEYGADKLDEAKERDDAERAHIELFVAFAGSDQRLIFGAEQSRFAALFFAETENLRAALRRSLALGCASMFAATSPFVWQRGLGPDAIVVLSHVVETVREPTAMRAAALFALGSALQFSSGEYARVEAMLGESVALTRTLKLERELPLRLTALGASLLVRDPAAAMPVLEEAIALAQRNGHVQAAGMAGGALARASTLRGDFAAAERILDAGVAAMSESGTQEGIGWSTLRRAGVALLQGKLDEALPLLVRSNEAFVAVERLSGRASVAVAAAMVASLRGDRDIVPRLVGAADVIARRDGFAFFLEERELRATALAKSGHAEDDARAEAVRWGRTSAKHLDELIRSVIG
jgi:hypothetical protein